MEYKRPELQREETYPRIWENTTGYISFKWNQEEGRRFNKNEPRAFYDLQEQHKVLHV